MHGLGDDEAEVMGEAVREPLTPVRGGIRMTERGLYPDVAIAHLDRADRYVVRPQIECAAAFEIEAGMVPMTGQDSVLEAAALEREAHVRAAIVETKDTSAVVHDKNWTMATVHTAPPHRIQPLTPARECEFLVRRVHDYRSLRIVWLSADTTVFADYTVWPDIASRCHNVCFRRSADTAPHLLEIRNVADV